MENYLSWLETEIRKQRFGERPKSLYDPLHYIMSLGGKRLRPLLTLLAYSIYRKDVEQCVPYAAAVEAFHNFTLMHDDIMDSGLPSSERCFVHDVVMLVKVYDLFLGLENNKLKDVLSLFNACAAGVCEGQQWDMEFESKRSVTEAQYIEMIRLKTAVLLGFSLELGAVLGDAPTSDRKLLRDAGVNLGIGFQLKDDLLDVYADKKKFGKQVGGDIIANKKTFLLIKAAQRAKGADKKELHRWLSARKFDKRKKVAAVSALYDRLGIQSWTEKKIEEYLQKSLDGLRGLTAAENAKPLLEFVRDQARRQR